MKFKKTKEGIPSSDIWYDLTDGGYIKPSEMLKDQTDVKEVEKAIETVKQFIEEAVDAGWIDTDN